MDVNFDKDAEMYEVYYKTLRPQRIIGVSGKAGSGKSTICNIIQRQMGARARVLSFATPLKELATKIGWDGEKDMKGRRLLQLLGTEVMRDCIDDNIWLKHWVHGLHARRDEPVVCTDDMRFPNEVDLVRACGGVLIKLEGRSNIAEGTSDHSSEQELHTDYDYIIDTSGNLSLLEDAVVRILKELTWIS